MSDLSFDNIEEIIQAKDVSGVDLFGLIKKLVVEEGSDKEKNKDYVDRLYSRVLDEIVSNTDSPQNEVKFGTSGWRGILGKDLYCRSVAQVTLAIIEMYKNVSSMPQFPELLQVSDFKEVQKRGCVLGYDNRFGEDVLAFIIAEILIQEGIHVYFAGESTTGVLSAAVLQLNAGFSINLTPSHNPLEYGGFKFNAADAGPAASEITNYITSSARKIIQEGRLPQCYADLELPLVHLNDKAEKIDSLKLWQDHVRSGQGKHGIEYDKLIQDFETFDSLAVVIDSVHGASRLHVRKIFNDTKSSRLLQLRCDKDVTFGGVAPEPSSANLIEVVETLKNRKEKLKLGAIIDPDGDRIRFTDGDDEISMNQFGAMAYYFLHEVKLKKGMVAKTVATSNLANSIARSFSEKIFEPPVGFKEFKSVIGEALVCFEESDGISIIGHTPEKDAYIGLLLALDMIMTTGKNLGEYLSEIENKYGRYYPSRDGVEVSLKGDKLLCALSGLEKYIVGQKVVVGEVEKTINEVIDIDGRKMIFSDGSWVMVRPSGTEPKVRFYVEARTADGAGDLVKAAKRMLAEIGLMEFQD